MTARAPSSRGARMLLVGLALSAVTAFFALSLEERLSVAAFVAERQALEEVRRAHPAATSAAFVGLYVAATALSLPIAAPLTLVGGALFGLAWGVVLVSIASTTGATAAFLAARFVARDWVQARLGHRLAAINEGVGREGAFYLLTLRLIPLVPFWMVNLVMGLTAIPTWTFAWMSQLGMLPATLIYVYAGTQLGSFEVGPGLVLALLLLAASPGVGRGLVAWLRARRVYRPWRHLRPSRFDYNVVVIGGGSAGLIASYVAAATRAKVALVERHRLGGDCLYTGCVPSKALVRSAAVASQIRRASEWGIAGATAATTSTDVMTHVQRVVRAVEPHDSPERYARLGVDVVSGTARLSSPWSVTVTREDGGTATLTARAIVLATGARPTVPDIPGLRDIGYLTSDTVWNLSALPSRLLVLGGGPIGCELAQAFARLGSAVTLVEAGPRLLPREDPDASTAVLEALQREAVAVRLSCTATRASSDGATSVLHVQDDGCSSAIAFDQILVAVGRTPVTTGLGLEELGIAPGARGTIDTDERLSTCIPNVFACGDVAGPFQFTHTASHQAATAVTNALLGGWWSSRVSYRAVPWATFTDPQVAHVGTNETDAARDGVAYEVTRFDLGELDRAIVDGETSGFVKVLTQPGSDRILGVTAVGAHASETLAEFVLAMTHGLGLRKVLSTIHTYPTFAEQNRLVAGAWRRGRVTRGQHELLAALHAWRRGESSWTRVLVGLRAAMTDGRPSTRD